MASKTDIFNHNIDKGLTETVMRHAELFQYQDETPMTRSSETRNIMEASLKNYMEALRNRMGTYCKTHNTSTKV